MDAILANHFVDYVEVQLDEQGNVLGSSYHTGMPNWDGGKQRQNLSPGIASEIAKQITNNQQESKAAQHWSWSLVDRDEAKSTLQHLLTQELFLCRQSMMYEEEAAKFCEEFFKKFPLEECTFLELSGPTFGRGIDSFGFMALKTANRQAGMVWIEDTD